MFKKLRKVYRIFFPKSHTESEVFEYKMIFNNLITSFKKEKENYIVTLSKCSMFLEVRNHKHSDYKVFEQVFNTKQYEPILSLIKLNLKVNNDLVIIDAGANVGYTSLYFLNELNQVFIYAIEPSKCNIEVCKKNVSLNNYDERVQYYQKALSHKEGLNFSINTEGVEDWALKTNQDEKGTIEGITLNEIISNNKLAKITFLKIDIEGAERFIFSLESDLSFLNITQIIAIEIHEEYNIRDSILEILKHHGFYLFESGELTIGINKNLIK